MFQIYEAYKNLILQTTLSLSLTLLLTFLKIPVFFLQGLHTYIQPENLGQNNNQNGIKAAIRRPSNSDDGAELKRRSKTKDKHEFDENKAQIFRLKLDEGHLVSRLYFNDYCNSFVYSIVAFSCLLLYMYLDRKDEDSGILASGNLVVIILGFVSLFKVSVLLVKVSFERSASKRSEKQLSVIIGVLGFVLGLMITSGAFPPVLDFDFGSIDGSGKFLVTISMGCIASFMYMPAGKSARSFWLGTDQLRCNLSMISCGWFARMILYANYLLPLFSGLLWINPLAEIFINKHSCNAKGVNASCSTGRYEKLVGNVGWTEDKFTKFRLWCLFLSGIIHVVAVRPNLQMYLNEAVLSWYQRLHANKVPDLDFSRAKVFLHNHYLCLVALQFFAPAILVLLLLGLSLIDVNSFGKLESVCSFFPCSVFVKEIALFLAWWVVFVWSIYTSGNLVLYRRGILYIS